MSTDKLVREAVDAGVTFFDNRWEYHDGGPKERMGVALQGLRNRVVLMSKLCTQGRDKKVAMRMLEESLRSLRHRLFRRLANHEVIYWSDPDVIFAPDGPAAKREGNVRFVGFTDTRILESI